MVLRFNRKQLCIPYAVFLALFVIAPLFVIAYYAFTDGQGKISFENFTNFFLNTNTLGTLLYSFALAIVTTLVCLLIAYPTAYILARSNLKKKHVLLMLFVLPMWINSLLRTYAVKIVLYMLEITNAWVSVTIGMVYDFFPFMLLPLYSVLSGMDKSLIEASQDLGASPLKTLIKVRLPLSLPGIVSGVLMVFMPTVSTFAISDVLGDTSTYMFGNIINQWFANSGGWNIGSAYSFLLLVLIALTVLLANKITKGQVTEVGGVL